MKDLKAHMTILKSINDLGRHTEPIRDEIEAALKRVLDRGWYVLGPEVSAFESEFAAYCGVPYCVTLANGTDALETALRALGIGKGQRVLTVGNAGMYSTVAILAAGAQPVYADVCPDTLLIQTAEIERLLASKAIDALIVTHLYGLLAEMEPIIELAAKCGIPVIEDCAQSHGARRDGRRAGSFGDIACFSFYPTKNLGALGDGGAIVTGRAELDRVVRQLRQYGWSDKYQVALAGGFNSRLDEMQAAILRVKLPYLDIWNARRRAIARRYSEGIRHADLNLPPVRGEEYVGHLYVLRSIRRDALRRHLSASGVPCDVHYPVADFDQATCRDAFDGGAWPHTRVACQQVLTLPCFPEMQEEEVDAVISVVNAFL